MRFETSTLLVVSMLAAGAGVLVQACDSTNAPPGVAPAADGGGKGDATAQGDASPKDAGANAPDEMTPTDGGTSDAPTSDAPSAGSAGGEMACSNTGAPGATTVTTPFAAPNDSLTFTPPNIPCNVVSITSYGAKSDGDTATPTKNTDAFTQAVAALGAAGGVVDVPPGSWLTGPIRLASNVELHVEAGATILFSTDFADYGFTAGEGGVSAVPLVPTRWEGLDVMNGSPLIYCLNCTNVAITGSGTLYGQGAAWWDWKTPSVAEDERVYASILTSLGALDDAGMSTDAGIAPDGGVGPRPVSGVVKGLRPTMIECNGCKNFLVQDVTIKDGPYWTVHPLYSENVIIRHAHILSGKEAPIDGGAAASNGDGIDPDSCKNVLIENIDFDTSDDPISFKSGLNEDGVYVGRPTEEVVVRNITAARGHAISFGSEMSGGLKNIYVTSDTTNTLNGMQYLLRIKTLPGRGGTIENVWYENTTGSGWSNYAVEMTTNYSSPTIPVTFHYNPALLPYLKNVTVKNVSGTSAKPALNLAGLPQAPFQNIVFDSVNLGGTGANGCTSVTGVTLKNSTISGDSGVTSISCP
jgi:polygalacturonase